MIFNGNRETDFYKGSARTEEGLIGRIYSVDPFEIAKPPGANVTRDKNAGKTDAKTGKALDPVFEMVGYPSSVIKKGVPSIFNRYEIFYFDNYTNTPNGKGEPLFDTPDRLSQYMAGAGARTYAESAIKNPTAQNLINWSKNGGSVSVEYDWPDFLWCKDYGKVPNNYMVTLRRFAVPAADDLFFIDKALAPDIARMVTWVDGETNKWENVGLKFSTSLTWKKFESEIQSVNVGDQGGFKSSEGQVLEGAGGLMGAVGSVMTTLAKLARPEQAAQQRTQGSREEIDPYHDTMKVHGPIDIVKEVMVREKGINFDQTFTLTFEYELKSIDGINGKLAFMDLFANIMMLVTNKAKWWGGEIKYWGNTNFRNVQPLGNPALLTQKNADYKGYLDSIMSTLQSGLQKLTKGKDVTTPEGFTNLLSGIGGTLMDGIVGGGLDKMGRPGAIAVNSLLSGEDTGNWHVMVGNPINPIISVGNLIMEKADIEFGGVLGPDDFPNKLKVICTLKPARPRAREGIIDMFHRNGRIYTTIDPKKMGAINKVKERKVKADPLNPNNTASNDDVSRYTTTLGANDASPFSEKPDLYTERFSNWVILKEDDTIVPGNAAGIF